MSDRLAREIRTMLGPHDDTAQPVVLLVRDLVAKYDQAKAEREWTSVEDGLPEPYTEVYIWPRPDFGVTHHTGYLSRRTGETEFHWFNNTYETNYGVEENTVRVTHWRPLPAPP